MPNDFVCFTFSLLHCVKQSLTSQNGPLPKRPLAKTAPEKLKRPRVKMASRQNGPGFVETALGETAPV